MQDYQEMMQDTFDEITQIGAGGGGTIFKAHHKRLDKEVVLKKIHTSQLGNISRRAELDILKNLKHSYIPQIVDFIEYGDEVFTVMEYIPGKSFAQLLDEKQKFARKDVVKWCRQLCEVVEYLHSQTPPIIHCDIKPANVMLTPAGDICLIDFNISGVKSEEGISAIGYSNGYAPVEQFAVVARRLEKAMKKKAQGNLIIHTKNPAEDDRTEITLAEDDRTEITSTEGDRTEITPAEDDRTEITPTEGDRTEITPAEGDRTEIGSAEGERDMISPIEDDRTSSTAKSLIRSMDDAEWAKAKYVEASVGKNLEIDERTDIYSVGATLYHILTGQKPRPFYQEQIPIRQLDENVSDGLAYVIETAMAVKPSERFKSSGRMLKAVRNLGILDKRYKSFSRRQMAAALLTGMLTVASVLSAIQGRRVMAQERLGQYYTYVEEMDTARENRDYDSLYVYYEEALSLSEGMPEAYYQMAVAYFQQKQYTQCIDYLSKNVYANSALSTDGSLDRFYYITASCYFELDDYKNAVPYYKRAVEQQPEEIAYYRDYVVALARNGEADEAERVLKEAMQRGVSADVMSLLNGEIALLKGNYRDCEKYLSECLSETEDDYMKVRAYTKLDDAYQLMYQEAEQYDKRIGILEEALAVLPADYQITLMERLAQVYINYSYIAEGDYYSEKAIALLAQMEERGYATFTSRYNIAVLYEKMGNYGASQEQLDMMLGIYPGNYIIYKRKAFVELEAQAEKQNQDRDYHVFQEYYGQAFSLYGENAEGEDVEMLSLKQLYGDLVLNGWLD